MPISTGCTLLKDTFHWKHKKINTYITKNNQKGKRKLVHETLSSIEEYPHQFGTVAYRKVIETNWQVAVSCAIGPEVCYSRTLSVLLACFVQMAFSLPLLPKCLIISTSPSRRIRSEKRWNRRLICRPQISDSVIDAIDLRNPTTNWRSVLYVVLFLCNVCTLISHSNISHTYTHWIIF